MLLDLLIETADFDRPTLQRVITGLGHLGFLLLQNTEDAIQQQ